jgi:hypothetical protein
MFRPNPLRLIVFVNVKCPCEKLTSLVRNVWVFRESEIELLIRDSDVYSYVKFIKEDRRDEAKVLHIHFEEG